MESDKKTDIKPMTLTELARKYGISNKTMLAWLKRKKLIKRRREGYLFTPLQIKQIYEALGEP